MPGSAWLKAALSAWSVALNGKSAETTRITSKRPVDTAPLGTSARKAIGSESRKASSEAARTSRAIPPIATPSAANASAPPAIAASHSGNRPSPAQ